MTDSVQKKTIFEGSAEDLVPVIAPFISRPDFCSYDDNIRIDKTKLDKKRILLHKELLRALAKIQANMSFNQSTVTDVWGASSIFWILYVRA